MSMINQALLERYRCAESIAQFSLSAGLAPATGFFRFGPDVIGYGRTVAGDVHPTPENPLPDNAEGAIVGHSAVALPFDPNQVIDNLRLERYAEDHNLNGTQPLSKKILRDAYYSLRPLFPISVRRHFQKAYLRGWAERPFPKWPVDVTVENLLEDCLKLAMQAKSLSEVPFIWFWPNGANACALMTHDVETVAGKEFSSQLMDINESFGIPASFQVVPELRYEVEEAYLSSIRNRGFEVAVQDLNHDGRLYSNREQFLERAKLIRQYKTEFRATGFRAAILYRNLDWLPELGFSYDMSVPNVGHLDPQSGGCCTVFPYFIGDTLEIPVTAIQDYSLFHILGDYGIELWKKQTSISLAKHGLMHFIVHPDYIIEEKPQQTYRELLTYICSLRSDKNVWVTLPREVDRWWRARTQMKLVQSGTSWHIEGPDSERASIAYATLQDGKIQYRVGQPRPLGAV
jgi:hypothetical protein